MVEGDEIASLGQILSALQRVFDAFDNRGLLIGGAAVSLLSQPRFTADVDALLLASPDEVPKLLEVGKQCGFDPRVSDPAAFAKRTRVVLLRHRASGVDVDISLGLLPFEEEAVERGVTFTSETYSIRIPTVEDLIIMKAVAHRPQDLVDIRNLLKAHVSVDRARITAWVTEFAEALDRPDLLDGTGV